MTELEIFLAGNLDVYKAVKIAEACPEEFSDIVKNPWSDYALGYAIKFQADKSKCDQSEWKWKPEISDKEKKIHIKSLGFICEITTLGICYKMMMIAWLLSQILLEVPKVTEKYTREVSNG